MALIFCPECGTQVSEHAQQCIKCSYPIYKLNTINTQNSSLHLGKEEIKTNNTIVWILAFAPLIGNFLQGFIAGILYGNNWLYFYNKYWWVTIVLNTTLCAVDEITLKKKGVNTSSFNGWWILLIPVYLYKRANYLGQQMAYFWVWLAIFALTLIGIL